MNVLDRIKSIFDEGVFMELGALNTEANVITGYGTVGERLVYAYGQTGPVGLRHAEKIASLYEMALKMGAPVVGFLDSKGVVLDEGVDVLNQYGKIFSCQAEARGIIPLVSVITGDCIGTAALTAGISDFVIMCGDKARLMLSSPNTLKGGDGKYKTSPETVHVLCGEAECASEVRKLIGFIPSNNMEEAYLGNMSASGKIMDLSEPRKIIDSLIDGEFFELKKDYAKTVITGFGVINGYSSGIIFASGAVCPGAADKIVSFVKFCDAYNMPVVTFTDIEGYTDSPEGQLKMIRSGAALLSAFSEASVPKVNVITGNASGSAYLTMNSKQIGCDIVYAWKDAKVSLFPKESYKIIQPEDSLSDAAAKGFIDEIIDPLHTREYVISALEMLASKRVHKRGKKHSGI